MSSIPSASSASSSSSSSSGSATPPYPPASSEKAVAAPVTDPASVLKEYTTFDEMGLSESVLRGVYAFGFEKPSPIQQKAIVPMIEGHDVLAQAQSGTGKTGAFVIGGISRIDAALNEVQMVVIVPTRELADQITKVASSIGTFMGLRVYTAVGGTPVHEDLALLQQGRGRPAHIPHVLVVTPGRFFDLLHRNAVSPSTARVLVLDEADQMLDAKFLEQIECILSLGWPSTMQVGLFSATMIPELADKAKALLNNPVTILLEAAKVSLDGINQYYVEVEREDQKLETLCDLYDHLSIQQANIFVNTRAKAEWLAEHMKKRGFDLSFIHGEMDVDERRRRMDEFRAGKSRVLISTDLLARGIDVHQVSLVINFELPIQRENYIHRIGRSGRYGRKGASINLITERERRAQAEIESFYGKKVLDLPADLKIM